MAAIPVFMRKPVGYAKIRFRGNANVLSRRKPHYLINGNEFLASHR